MKVQNMLFVAKKNFRARKKANRISIVLLAISIIAIVLSDIMINAIDKFSQYTIYDTPDASILTLESLREEIADKIIDDYADDTRIVDIDEFYTYGLGAEYGETSQFVWVKRFNPRFSEYTENISELNNDEILIPKYYNADGEYTSSFSDESEYEDGSKYIGQKIKILYSMYEKNPEEDGGSTREIEDKLEKEYTVAGVYDNSAMCYGHFFISQDEYNSIVNSNGIKDTNLGKGVIVIAKSYNYVQELGDELGASNNIHLSEGFMFYRMIPPILKMIGYLLFVISIITIVVHNTKSIKARTGELGLLKAIGYKDNNIFAIFIIELVMTFLISIVLSVIIIGLLLIGANLYIQNFLNIFIRFLHIEIPLSTMAILTIYCVASFVIISGIIKQKSHKIVLPEGLMEE